MWLDALWRKPSRQARWMQTSGAPSACQMFLSPLNSGTSQNSARSSTPLKAKSEAMTG